MRKRMSRVTSGRRPVLYPGGLVRCSVVALVVGMVVSPSNAGGEPSECEQVVSAALDAVRGWRKGKGEVDGVPEAFDVRSMQLHVGGLRLPFERLRTYRFKNESTRHSDAAAWFGQNVERLEVAKAVLQRMTSEPDKVGDAKRCLEAAARRRRWLERDWSEARKGADGPSCTFEVTFERSGGAVTELELSFAMGGKGGLSEVEVRGLDRVDGDVALVEQCVRVLSAR